MYEKQEWIGGKTGTPATPERMNYIEEGIYKNSQAINGEESMGSIVVEDVNCKNLLPISENETITLSKTFYFDKPLQAGTYRISVDSVISDGTAGIYLFNFIRSDEKDDYYFYLEDDNLAETITINAECKGVIIYSQNDWVNSKGKTTTFNKTMIKKNSTEISYVPYKKFGYNSTESMGKIVVDDISCKNKFNINNLSMVTGTVDYSNGTIIVQQYANHSNQTLGQLAPDLVAGKEYIFSFKSTGNEKYIYLAGSKTQWRNNTSRILTQKELDNIIYFYGEVESTSEVTISRVQIEEGSTATNYSGYIDFNNNAVLVDDFIVAQKGFSILEQAIYKQNNRYFGDVIIKKESGNFTTTNEIVCTLNKKNQKSVNSGCFLANSQWGANGIGYMFIDLGGNVIISDYVSTSYNYAKFHIDIVV